MLAQDLLRKGTNTPPVEHHSAGHDSAWQQRQEAARAWLGGGRGGPLGLQDLYKLLVDPAGFCNTHAALAAALATVFVLVELVKIARRHCPEAIEDSCFRAIDVCNHAAGKRAEHQAKVAKTSKTSKSKPSLKQGGAKRSMTQTAR